MALRAGRALQPRSPEATTLTLTLTRSPILTLTQSPAATPTITPTPTLTPTTHPYPTALCQRSKVPEDRKGEFMGIANFVQGFGRIAGPLLASAAFHVSDGAGHWPLFLCLAFVYATGPCAMVTVWRKLTLDLDDGS